MGVRCKGVRGHARGCNSRALSTCRDEAPLVRSEPFVPARVALEQPVRCDHVEKRQPVLGRAWFNGRQLPHARLQHACVGLQPGSVAAWMAYGCSLDGLRLQPGRPTVAAWATCGRAELEVVVPDAVRAVVGEEEQHGLLRDPTRGKVDGRRRRLQASRCWGLQLRVEG